MPNHIKNRITLSGDAETIAEMLAQFSTNYPECQQTSFDGELIFKKDSAYGWLSPDGSFSFRKDGNIEKVESMPVGWTPCMEPAWTRFPDFKKVIPPPNDDAYNDIPSQEVAQSSPNWWLKWNTANWGTKWNSYDCEKLDGDVWQFDTAWSPVPSIIAEIAKRFPKVNITYEYSSEDIGEVCGLITFVYGTPCVRTQFEGGSKEAYELAFKLRPDRADDYELVDGNYKYKEDE